jgi:hypothetical protein
VFRAIWHLNGVLLLLTFLLVAGIALVGATSFGSYGRHDRAAAAPAAVLPATGEKLFFGGVETIEGSSFVVLPLETRHTGGGKFSSGPSSGDTRNLLFFDATAGTGHWLRPDHRGAVLSRELLGESGVVHRWERSPSGPVRWIRYELALADTNGDGEIDAGDARAIAVTGPEGKDLTIVLADLDQVLGYATPGHGKVVVFFRKGDASFAGEIDLAQRKLVRTTPLPKS